VFYRSEFKYLLEGLLDDDPGVDARELYVSRERLAELAAMASPEEEPQLKSNLDGVETKKSEDDQPAKEQNDKSIDKTGPPNHITIPDESIITPLELSKTDYNQALREIKLLYEFIIDEFQKVDDKLKRLTADGMISWKLLWAFIRRGQRLETSHSSTGEKQGFIMTSWEYSTDCTGRP
jgi:hypothetical protein